MGRELPADAWPPASQRRARVMVVDDDEDFLRLLTLRLKRAGYETKAVHNAGSALAVLPRFKPDAVIVDLRLGAGDDMHGIDLISSLQELDPGLPLLVLTAFGTVPDAVAATQKGAFAFLSKPVDHHELQECLAGALRQSSARVPDYWRSGIVARGRAMQDLLARAGHIAPTDHSVMIMGQSGSGKEVLARTIHKASGRKGPFVPLNCAAIPEELLESELFGYRRGAFTGAAQHYPGLFQQAEGGTLLLDEIGEMPAALQAKLLRVVEDRQVRPLGSTGAVAVNVRLISATNRNLAEALKSGEFREDLYYRLNVIAFELPRLAERIEDIPVLAGERLRQIAAETRTAARSFSPGAMEQLLAHDWPGNVRQLFNVVDQAAAVCPSPVISAEIVQGIIGERPASMGSLTEARDQFVREYLIQLLTAVEGNVTQAARLARRNRSDFHKLLNKHGIEPGGFKHGTQSEAS